MHETAWICSYSDDDDGSNVGDSMVAAGRPSDRIERRPSYAGTSNFDVALCSGTEWDRETSDAR